MEVTEIIELKKNFISNELANEYFNRLYNNIAWEQPNLKNKRKMAYYSYWDEPYTYANVTIQGNYWNSLTSEILELVIEGTGLELDSVLLNLYNDGKDEIRWHSDKEVQIGPDPIIPCLNLGATRKFWFLNKSTGEKFYRLVENGDLLIMGKGCQREYLHAILKEKEIKTPRISLTFRKIYK